LGLLILLAGCRLDVDVATTVAEDGSGTVVVTVHADDELLAAAPGLVADLRLDDLAAAGWTVDGPESAAGDGTRLVLTKPFASPEQANLVLAEVGAPLQVALAQAREFALVRTTVTGAVTGTDLDAFADAELVQALGGAVPLAGRVTPEQLAAGFGLTVGFSLPGEVVAANGTVDQGNVAWQPSMAPGSVTPLEAAAELRDEGALAARDRESLARRGLWAWGGLVALVAVVGAMVWWIRGRRHRRPTTV
jgi:hypothetical protein